MNRKSSSEGNLKQKALHELKEFAVLSLYLAFFFCALAIYRMLLLREFGIVSLKTFAFPLITALIVAKVIMIGEYANIGKSVESRPLIQSAISKAFLFCLLVFAFHIVEELIKHLVHGEGFAGVFSEVRIDEMLGRSLLVFCTFITLFGYRGFRRKLGEERFNAMVFGSEDAEKSEAPAHQ